MGEGITSQPVTDRSTTVLSRLLTGVVAVVVLCSFSPPPSASPSRGGEVYIVVSDSARYYQQVAATIGVFMAAKFPETGVSLHDSASLELLNPGDGALLICIGTTASTEAFDRFPRQPQLSLFITRQAWESISGGESNHPKAALFMDQPATRLFALGQALVPEARVFATVLGPATTSYPEQLESVATGAGLEVRHKKLSANSNPLSVLTPLLADADVFVPIPDTAAINRNIARWGLHLAFRHKIPVIGFSRAYTDAGAAASLYTSTSDISRQAVEWLEQYFSEAGFDGWKAYPPRYFTVSVNSSVVNTLGLSNQTPEQLHQRVLEKLGESSP